MNEETPLPDLPPPQPPRAALRRPQFQLVWLIPILAAVIAGYLGYRTLVEQGPLLTLTFATADGLAAGQTQVKYKAVALGTVESIDLAKDNSHVIVKVRMSDVGARFLNSHARYWVERPRLNFADISGIETLVSGAYISVDPGAPGGTYQSSFTGLEQPPGVRSDEPGRTYTLTTYGLGSLNSGSPVYYRDVQVGEVLGYDMGDGLGPVSVSIFVRAPFDNLVRPDSVFWNTSGIALGEQGGVLQLQLQSVQALLAGGIGFSLPSAARDEAPSPDGASFRLYASRQEADTASYATQVKLVSYLTDDVSGLTRGAPVNVLGIQIGVVSGIALQVNPDTGQVRVRVSMQVQPERALQLTEAEKTEDPLLVFRTLVAHGLRVELGTANYVTGQKMIALAMDKNAPPAQVSMESDGSIVLPSEPGQMGAVLANLSGISAKLNQVPFQQIGDNLNDLLKSANATLAGPEIKDSIRQLTVTLASANATLQGVNQGFGQDSDFQRNLLQLLQQSSAAMQSVQALSDYLNRHPQALLFGRGSQ